MVGGLFSTLLITLWKTWPQFGATAYDRRPQYSPVHCLLHTHFPSPLTRIVTGRPPGGYCLFRSAGQKVGSEEGAVHSGPPSGLRLGLVSPRSGHPPLQAGEVQSGRRGTSPRPTDEGLQTYRNRRSLGSNTRWRGPYPARQVIARWPW